MLIALTLLVATHVHAGLGIQEMEQCVKVGTLSFVYVILQK